MVLGFIEYGRIHSCNLISHSVLWGVFVPVRDVIGVNTSWISSRKNLGIWYSSNKVSRWQKEMRERRSSKKTFRKWGASNIEARIRATSWFGGAYNRTRMCREVTKNRAGTRQGGFFGRKIQHEGWGARKNKSTKDRVRTRRLQERIGECDNWSTRKEQATCNRLRGRKGFAGGEFVIGEFADSSPCHGKKGIYILAVNDCVWCKCHITSTDVREWQA